MVFNDPQVADVGSMDFQENQNGAAAVVATR